MNARNCFISFKQLVRQNRKSTTEKKFDSDFMQFHPTLLKKKIMFMRRAFGILWNHDKKYRLIDYDQKRKYHHPQDIRRIFRYVVFLYYKSLIIFFLLIDCLLIFDGQIIVRNNHNSSYLRNASLVLSELVEFSSDLP